MDETHGIPGFITPPTRQVPTVFRLCGRIADGAGQIVRCFHRCEQMNQLIGVHGIPSPGERRETRTL
jgi:hypothetical protein